MVTLSSYLNTTPSRGTYPALWAGVVINATPNNIWVEAPTLTSEPIRAANTIPTNLTPGERVVLGFLEGRAGAVVVLASMTPTVPAHTHTPDNILWPGWATTTLSPGWEPVTGTTHYPGIRYRVEGENIRVHGAVTGGPGPITALPVTPAHTSPLTAFTDDQKFVAAALTPQGNITTPATGTLYLNVTAPLT